MAQVRAEYLPQFIPAGDMQISAEIYPNNWLTPIHDSGIASVGGGGAGSFELEFDAGSWTSAGSQPVAYASSAAVCEYGSGHFVGGGFGAQTFWTVDNTLTWTPITNSGGVGFGCCVAIGTDVYSWQRASANGVLKKWDGASWSTISGSPPAPMYSATILSGVIYVCDWNSELWIYDHVGNTYTSQGQFNAVAFDGWNIHAYNGKIYGFGTDASGSSVEAKVYDGSFTTLATPPLTGNGAWMGSVLIDNNIVLLGSFDSSYINGTDEVAVYNIDTDSWVFGPDTPNTTSDTNIFVQNDIIYGLDQWNGDFISIAITSTSAAPDTSWVFLQRDDGKLQFDYSLDGPTVTSVVSSVAMPITSGIGFVKVTILNTGSDADVKFYTSLDGESWTQLGTTQNPGEEINPFNSGLDLVIGAISSESVFDGIIYSVQVQDGIDGVIVANPNFRNDPITSDDTSFYDSVGNLFLIGNGSLISGGAEYVPQGTYYADNYQVDSSGMINDISCRDRSKFLQETTKDSGLVFKNLTAAEAVAIIAKESGVLNSKVSIELPYSKQIIRDGPVSYWDFSQLELDNNAFAFGGSTRLTSNKLFYMNRLSQVDNDVMLPFVIEFKVKLSGATGTIFNYGISGEEDEFTIRVSSGDLIYTAQGSDSSSVNTNLNDGLWHHVMAVVQSTTVTTYVDGKTYGTTALTTADIGGTSGYVTLGNRMTSYPSTFGSSFLTGSLDDVRIWASTKEDLLELIDIKLNKSAASTYGKEYNCLAFFPMTEGTGDSVASSKDFYNVLEADGASAWETTGVNTLKDRAGLHHGTINDMTSFNGDSPITSEISKSYTFNTSGSNDYITVLHDPDDDVFDFTTEMALEAWIYRTSGFAPIICKRNPITGSAASFYEIGVNSGNKLYLRTSAGSDLVASSGSVSAGAWHHVVVSIEIEDGDVFPTVSWYIDGELDSTDALVANLPSNTDVITIGFSPESTHYLIGKLAALSLWDRPLSATEVASHYKASLIDRPQTFPILWASEDTLWSSALTIALADLGMFYFREDDTFRYESAKALYNTQYPEHATAQWILDEDTNIVNGGQTIELLVNKVIVTVNPTQSESNTTTEIWNANSGESLAATTLASALAASEEDTLSFNTTVNDIGVLEPIFNKTGFVRIGDEIISYSSADDTHLYTLERGLFNTTVGSYAAGEFVGEAREYNLQWSDSPVLVVKYPFLTAQLFDGTVDVNLWTSNPTSGHLVVSLNPSFDSENIYQVLQGTNPVTGLDNFFVIAGVPAQDQDAKGITTEVASEYAQKIRRYGLKDITIDNPFIQDASYAKQIADFVLAHNDEPVKVISLQTLGLPHLQLGDRINIDTFDQLSIVDIDYWIMNIEIGYNGGVEQTLTLKQVD
jgi:hypothetical protein